MKAGYDCFLFSSELTKLLNEEVKKGNCQIDANVHEANIIYSLEHDIERGSKNINRKLYRFDVSDNKSNSNDLFFYEGALIMSEYLYDVIVKSNLRFKRAKIKRFEIPVILKSEPESIERTQPIFEKQKESAFVGTIFVIAATLLVAFIFFRIAGVI
ncbi:hypothetical protein E1N66_22805 [Pantoea allii]|nr:hypothetical protein [Pantoea allii]THB82092.1 hypothetical protein E1N66_22805 [Pantoea allii]